MKSNKPPRGFGFSFGTLQRDAQRLLEALNDNTIGTPVVTRLPATFVADFTAQIALAAKLGTDKSGAIGTLGGLTQAQAQAQADFVRLASMARRAAMLAFPGQDTLLRSEFMVGVPTPRTQASIFERARSLLAACQKHADALAPHGWLAADNADLQAAVDALAGASRDQGTASDTKLAVTARRLEAGNALYKQCLVVQIGARKVYSAAQVAADASLVEGRARFLLDEFPPRASRPAAVAPVTPMPASVPVTVPVPAAA